VRLRTAAPVATGDLHHMLLSLCGEALLSWSTQIFTLPRTAARGTRLLALRALTTNEIAQSRITSKALFDESSFVEGIERSRQGIGSLVSVVCRGANCYMARVALRGPVDEG
jgi:hypothetical protein